ncbi:protein N-lysine methyltransferase METTL21D-like isoform X2 [Hetaerina americana]|uniref:protein N-lysine methyltransferase METTL21D-like isoform X2 n=1 Tax=Hetaerina americana TaxID=62018 RepID=UPI003A7F2867
MEVNSESPNLQNLEMEKSKTRFFTRVLEIKGICGELNLFQKEVGDTSCVVWDACVVLAKYLETLIDRKKNKDLFKSKFVVELGSGVGGAGLTAASFGADVVVTDLPEVISLLWSNIDVNRIVWDANGGKIVAKELVWGKENTSDWPTPDLILIADCVYYDQSLEPLLKTVEELARRETEVLICQELRDTPKQKDLWEKFFELLEEKFLVTKIPILDQHPQFSSADIVLLSARKKF